MISAEIQQKATANGSEAAFARPSSRDEGNPPSSGLTKREYIAAAIAAGFFANSSVFQGISDADTYAQAIVEYADALILKLEETACTQNTEQ